MDLLPMHDFVMLWSFENLGLPTYANGGISNSSMFYYLKATITNINSALFRKSVKNWDAVKLKVASFPKLSFRLKGQIFITGSKHYEFLFLFLFLFFEVTVLPLSFLRSWPPNIQT